MTWYFACDHCTAKWFAEERVMRCPRCSHRCESAGRQNPPWESRGDVKELRREDKHGSIKAMTKDKGEKWPDERVELTEKGKVVGEAVDKLAERYVFLDRDELWNVLTGDKEQDDGNQNEQAGRH